jgi:methionyl-tRNA formyltransferase
MLTGNSKVGLFVRCKDAWLEILELQSEGGKRLKAREYLIGNILEGKVLI